MITFVAGSFVMSMAMMVIPTSSASQRDLSPMRVRIGLSLTAPLIGVLIVSPKSVLSLLGTQYVSAETTLIILAFGIFPFSIVVNSISKFNYSGESAKLLLIGCTQIATFLITFLFLASQYGINGVAFSILIAYIASCVPAIIWSEHIVRIYLFNCVISILGGIVLGRLLGSLTSGSDIGHILALVCTVSVIVMINTVLKNIRANDIKHLLRIALKR
jgi:O-antigen/teichoic acid export membrane protein